MLRFGGAMAVGMEEFVDLHQGDLSGPVVPMSCRWSADATVLTCTPASPLAAHTTYAIHMGGGLMSRAGGAVLFLPAYSPDFSPIEPCWSKLKTFLRACAARTRALLEAALTTALQTILPEDIRGWFRHCGYTVASE